MSPAEADRCIAVAVLGRPVASARLVLQGSRVVLEVDGLVVPFEVYADEEHLSEAREAILARVVAPELPASAAS